MSTTASKSCHCPWCNRWLMAMADEWLECGGTCGWRELGARDGDESEDEDGQETRLHAE